MSDNDLAESALAMSSKRKSCSNCWHGRESPEVSCLLYSCDCATDIGNHQSNPSRWTSYLDGEEQHRVSKQAGYKW